MTDTTIKDDARRAAKDRRKAAKAALPDAAAQAMAHFLADVQVAPDDIVSGYRPIFSELDVTPLMRALHERGTTLCVPVIPGADRPLVFRVWTPDTPMVEGAFGAQIPADTAEVEPTLLIAPMLAFDRALWRLGYGGGFYDRTLEGLRAKRPTRAIGYAYAEQEMDAVPTEPTDQRLDGVITPDGLISRLSL
jgi:5-formyltetrahydrofolate cyclo-ligase